MTTVSRKQSQWCIWREDEDGVWWTGCGEAHQFTVDGPTANGQKFCGYCGQPLKEQPCKGER